MYTVMIKKAGDNDELIEYEFKGLDTGCSKDAETYGLVFLKAALGALFFLEEKRDSSS